MITAIAQRSKKFLSQYPGGARAPPCTCLRAFMQGISENTGEEPVLEQLRRRE